MKRGAVKTQCSELVALWVPKELVRSLDSEVRRTDTDRSKFVRVALREKLARHGVTIQEAV